MNGKEDNEQRQELDEPHEEIEKLAVEHVDLCGTGIATPSSRRRLDGVEVISTPR
jgi:hypothetical protein